MSYNIQMNYFDGSSYQELNPVTLLANVSDWQDNIYNKTEVDTIKNNLQNDINSIKKFIFQTSFYVNITQPSDSINGDIVFPDYIYNYHKIIVDFSNVSLVQAYIQYFKLLSFPDVGISNSKLIVYEIMSYNSTNYIYFSYTSRVNYDDVSPEFYVYRTLGSIKTIPYRVLGSATGTVNIYAY